VDEPEMRMISTMGSATIDGIAVADLLAYWQVG
jgi:hypothetical protein